MTEPTSRTKAADQRCLSCGRDTAAGTTLFAARRPGVDREANVEGYLCYACQKGTAVVAPDQAVPLSGRYVVIDLPGGRAKVLRPTGIGARIGG